MTRGVVVFFPNGQRVILFPFHICIEGLKSKILFRDDEDYDAFVKMIFVCAHRMGVDVIIYCVVSNHGHVCILAPSVEVAKAFAERLKIMYSRYFHNKYGEEGVLRRVIASAILIDSDWYLRNVLAYIPRNALDNGAVNVADLKKRDRERIMHTGDNLKNVKWKLNSSFELEPASCCNWRFFEKAFNNDQAFFLRVLGGVNSAEMKEKLVDAPRQMKNDNEFLKTVTDVCQKWYQKNPGELSLEKKARIIPFINRTNRTTVSQLARIFELSREKIEDILST